MTDSYVLAFLPMAALIYFIVTALIFFKWFKTLDDQVISRVSIVLFSLHTFLVIAFTAILELILQVPVNYLG